MASQLESNQSKHHASKFSSYEESANGPSSHTKQGAYSNHGMNFKYAGSSQAPPPQMVIHNN